MDKQINLMDIIKLYLKRWWCIAIAFVVGAVIAGIITMTLITPMYTSYGTLYTENTTDIVNQNVTEVNLSTVMVRKELVATYAEILSSSSFLQKVAEQSGLDYSASEILQMISMDSKNNTEILVISVTSPDPGDSHIIAQKILDMAPTFINEIVEGGSVKILDQPVFSPSPSSPNVVRNIEIGAILGVLVSLLLVFVVEILDNKVKDADVITEMFKYPILGEIPYFATNTKKDKKRKKTKEAEPQKA